jgi:hypothetical protein
MSEASIFPDTLLEEVSKYDIEYAVLDASEYFAWLMHDAGFELDFVDLKYALWSRGEGSLSNAGILWARPYCWPMEFQAIAENEWRRAFLELPPSAPILSLLSLALEFISATNPDEYFSASAADDSMQDVNRRFLAYRALESGRYEYAMGQFEKIKVPHPKDFLASAFTRLKLGDPDNAEDLLDQFSRIKWARLDFSDVLIQQALLDEISKQRPLKLFDADYIEELEEQAGPHSLIVRGKDFTLDSFCR